MEDLKQKYLSMLYGNKKLYKNHELQVVDNLIYTHRKYNEENLFTESQVLEYGENCFEAGFSTKALLGGRSVVVHSLASFTVKQGKLFYVCARVSCHLISFFYVRILNGKHFHWKDFACSGHVFLYKKQKNGVFFLYEKTP